MLIICWLLSLLVKVDAVTFEVNMTNNSQDKTEKKTDSTKIDGTTSLLHNKYMEEKHLTSFLTQFTQKTLELLFSASRDDRIRKNMEASIIALSAFIPKWCHLTIHVFLFVSMHITLTSIVLCKFCVNNIVLMLSIAKSFY